jgi:hypothetical protein
MPSRRHTVRAVWDNSPDTRRELGIAEASFLAVMAGISALVQLYLALGEDRAAWTTAHELVLAVSEAGVKDAWWKARNLLPTNPDDAPEAFWNRAFDSLVETRDRVSPSVRGTCPTSPSNSPKPSSTLAECRDVTENRQTTLADIALEVRCRSGVPGTPPRI